TKRRRGQVGSAVQRKNLRIEPGVPAGDVEPARGAQPGGILRAQAARVGDVIGLIMAEHGEIAAQDDDQIVVAIVEEGGVERKNVVEEAVLHAGVEAARALRLERWVVGVRQVETGRRAKAGAKGSVQPRPAAAV